MMRKYIQSSLILLLLLFCNTTLYAENVQESAKQYMENAIASILHILQDPAWRTEKGQKILYPQLRSTISTMFDFQVIASQAIGEKWKTFTDIQKQEFIQSFTQLLEHTYASYFMQYTDERVEIERVRANKKGNQVEVTTRLISSSKSTSMVYRLHLVNGVWKIYTVLIENINIMNSYQQQFQELLQKDTPDSLIKKIQQQLQTITNS